MPTIAKRLSRIPPYLFSIINKKVADARAAGRDIISLGAGDPDTPTLQPIVDAAVLAIQKPTNQTYPPYNGTPAFRKATADWFKNRFDVELNPDTEIIASIGSKEALVHLFMAYLDEGDIALLPDPGYPAYETATVLAGGEPYFMPLLEENGYLPDFTKIPSDVAKRAKLMWLNYPNNPTGAVASLEFFQRAVDFCKENDILLCSDQAYCEMTFDGYKSPSVLQAKGGKDVAIEFYSHSKSYNMAGWRIGFVAGNAGAIKALSTLKSNIDSGVFKAVQESAIAAYSVSQKYIDDLNAIYKERRDVAIAAFRELGWEIKPSLATFYLWLPVPKGFTSDAFVDLVFEKANVSMPQGNGYGPHGEGYFRVALTQDKEIIKKAIERIKDAGIKFNM
jgi:LL-diaminopimelate aminotransferase